MRVILVAAALAVAVPALAAAAPVAQGGGASLRSSGGSDQLSSVRVHRGDGDRHRDRDDRDRGDRDRTAQGDVFFPYRDDQGDTLWRPESFNDWWHERPNRAFPAWVARNAGCERMWWSGGGWRC